MLIEEKLYYKIADPLQYAHYLFSMNKLFRMDVASKSDFDFFMVRALANTTDDCYIELYNILLR